jgi:hypothetical protein
MIMGRLRHWHSSYIYSFHTKMFHMYVMNIAPTHANMTHGAATPWFGEMRDPIGRPRRWQSYAERACMYREYMYVCMCMVVLMGQAQALAVIC